MTIAASFTPKPAILSFAITHELLTMRLFLDSLANNNFRMKRYIIQPIAFFLAGLGFYIYNGVTWNTWMDYLPHIIGYAAICGLLSWSLYKKAEYKKKRQS